MRAVMLILLLNRDLYTATHDTPLAVEVLLDVSNFFRPEEASETIADAMRLLS